MDEHAYKILAKLVSSQFYVQDFYLLTLENLAWVDDKIGTNKSFNCMNSIFD